MKKILLINIKGIMEYYIDGKFEFLENAKIPFDDAGFLYGDGLFHIY